MHIFVHLVLKIGLVPLQKKYRKNRSSFKVTQDHFSRWQLKFSQQPTDSKLSFRAELVIKNML